MSKKIWIHLRKSQYSKSMVGKAMERNKSINKSINQSINQSNKQTDHDTFRRSWSNWTDYKSLLITIICYMIYPYFIQTILYFSFASIKLKTRLS
jgi:hypothetical protein